MLLASLGAVAAFVMVPLARVLIGLGAGAPPLTDPAPVQGLLLAVPSVLLLQALLGAWPLELLERDDEAALTVAITNWARLYGRYGYRRITALLRTEGWACNHKRVERIWRREGLKVPARQPKRGRLWLNDG